MLPSFVIGLREGLEAALIVGIIAAFLRKQRRPDLVRWVLVGVTAAVLLCLGIGIALDAYSRRLPQQQQEGLETVIAGLAVGMVTYMVVWMRRNSRGLKGQLEGLVAGVMSGSAAFTAGRALVVMAFLAVIREGLETVVFLLAAFNETANGAAAGGGAALGLVVSIGLGYAIYRGGVRLNLSKFFRITGVVLVLVAAGLVVNALHTAHEAGWLELGQTRVADLSWLVQPGTVQASLLTGMLGLQPHPVTIEAVGWLVYLVPVGLYVAWPPGRGVPLRAIVRGALAVGVAATVAAVVLATFTPSPPAAHPVTRADGVTASVASRSARSAVVRTEQRRPVTGSTGSLSSFRVSAAAAFERHAGLDTQRFVATSTGASRTGRPTTLPIQRVAALNGSRLPTGLRSAQGQVPASYQDVVTLTVWLDPRNDRVIDLRWTQRIAVVAGTAANHATLATPLASATVTLPAAARTVAVDTAGRDHARLDDRALMRAWAGRCMTLAALAFLVALGCWLAVRRRIGTPPAHTPGVPQPVTSTSAHRSPQIAR
ncbi:MAG: iron uptake transporter permease EfeU [Jatrophihabitans sp.]